MHLLRDCTNAADRWKSVVSPQLWQDFVNRTGPDWVRWNLTHEAGQQYTRKIPWSTLFGYICWDIWTTRCNQVFGEAVNEDPSNAQRSFYRACWDSDLLKHCKFYGTSSSYLPTVNNLSGDYVQLETDGSVLANGNSGCGGVIWDREGLWISGYSCKLVSVPVVIAEIIGITTGLHLCWNRGYRTIVIWTDCIEAMNLMSRECDFSHPFRDIIDDARSYFHRDWHVMINHKIRENMYMADYLAKMSHSMMNHFCILDHPPTLVHGVTTVEGGCV